jgi:hypothetical protein
MNANCGRLAILLLSLLFAATSVADDGHEAAPISLAREAYAQRSVTSTVALVAAEQALNAAIAALPDAARYDALLLDSRMLYFIGMHTADEAKKKTVFLGGRQSADAAEAIDARYADSAYYAAINLARWGEANGVFSSLKAVPAVKTYLAATMSRTTEDGKPGDSIDGAGPHRLMGRLYDKLPGMFGGSRSKSLVELRKATEMAPETALNTVYLAATLLEGSDAEKAEARQRLDALLKKDPKTLKPAAIPETEDDFKLARDLLAGKNI